MTHHIMIIEDEPALRLGLTDQFERAGYRVSASARGQTLLDALSTGSLPDLAILDLGLPDVDGTTVLETCARDAPNLPILVLTARANEADVVLGFKLGCCDYVTKPFSSRILAARVGALIQRAAPPSCQHIELGDVQIDFETYTATSPRGIIPLTTREFDILRYLSQQRGRPVSRHDLLDEVWGMDTTAGPRTVDTHIATLRKKVEPVADRPLYILSQRGIGYKLVAEPGDP